MCVCFFFPHSPQHLSFAIFFFYNNHSVTCQVVSYCAFDLYSPIISDTDNFLMSLLAICVPLERCLFRSSPHVSIRLFVPLMLSGRTSHVIGYESPFGYIICKYLIPYSTFLLNLLEVSFTLQKFLSFM